MLKVVTGRNAGFRMSLPEFFLTIEIRNGTNSKAKSYFNLKFRFKVKISYLGGTLLCFTELNK